MKRVNIFQKIIQQYVCVEHIHISSRVQFIVQSRDSKAVSEEIGHVQVMIEESQFYSRCVFQIFPGNDKVGISTSFSKAVSEDVWMHLGYNVKQSVMCEVI
eukprot:TRINITY_DN2820_c0_g1_i4.p5 TRINITY_DN2820_c0_g1~~TRINITY_DN2820_c0_g1_i4.p5  ORF type:complete len:101 (+),score=5.38 TRINITY_DN2820_c0_g1_i4:700-1002(+)